MVDPKNVLEAISPMLDPNGGIREVSHVTRIVGFMRDNATKLASRCVYLLIISATKNKEILKKLVASDGWGILSSWLEEAKADENLPLLTQLLEVFLILPVDIKTLQATAAPKTINKLSKVTDKRYADVTKSCKNVIQTWTSALKATHPAAAKRDSSDQSSRGTHSSTSSSPPKMDEDSADAVDYQDISASSTTVKSVSGAAQSQKPKISTVKTHPIKFRQTGLEAPSSTAKRTNPQDDVSAQKRPKLGSSGNVFDAINNQIAGGPINGTANLSSAAVRKAPTKVVEYRESSGFMEALSAPRITPATMQIISTTQAAQSAAASTNATSPTTAGPTGSLIRRKKRVVPGPNASEPEAKRTASPPADIPTEPSPPSLSPSTSTFTDKPATSGKRRVWWPDDSALRQVKYFEVDHEPIMHGRQHGDDMKKAEMQLDRNALQRAKQYGEQMMKADQDDAAEAANREFSSSTRMSPGYSPGSTSPGSHSWRRLIPIELPDNIANIQSAAGLGSNEKYAQAEHQLRVLEVVYFIRRDIPDSPAEPNPADLFAETAVLMKNIPLEVAPEFSSEPTVPVIGADFGSSMSPVYNSMQSTAPAPVSLPMPLSSVLAAISQQPLPSTTAPSLPPQQMDQSVPAAVPPPMPIPPPPFPFDPAMFPPIPPMPLGENGAPPPIPMPPWPGGAPGMPPPPFPPPPFFPPFPMPPGIPPMPGTESAPGNNSNSSVPPPPPGMPLPPFPGGVMPPFPPPLQTNNSNAPSNSPPTIVPVGSSSGPQHGGAPTYNDHHHSQREQMDSYSQQQQHPQQPAHNRRPPVSMRFPSGIPSRVPFGVCRYFFESGTCPRQSYCRFKHIQKPIETIDDQNGGDSPQNLAPPPSMNGGPKMAQPVAAGRR